MFAPLHIESYHYANDDLCLFVRQFFTSMVTADVISEWSVILTMAVQASRRQLTCTYCTIFCNYMTTPFLGSAEEEEWPQKYFMAKSARKNVPNVGVDIESLCNK